MKWLSLWSAAAAVVLFASPAGAETAGELVTIGGGEVSAGTDAASYELCQPGWCPLWTIQAGAVILHRSDASDDNPIGQLTGGDIPSFGWAGGPDIAVQRRLGSCHGLELRYFGALEWEIEDSLSAGPASLSANYASRLNSTELNWRRRGSECLTWLAGFRWIELHEELNLGTDVPIIPLSLDFNNNVDNHLYGGQVGVDVSLWNRASPLSINGVLKGGVYGNFADRDLAVILNGAPVAGVEDDDSGVAFVGDIGIAAAYPLSDHVALRGGYQLLWIDGVALADEQDSPDFDTSGDVFYHGALVGLELTW